MSKRPNLTEVATAAGSTRRREPAAPPPPVDQPTPPAERPLASTRRGTRQVAAHFPEDVAWQLRELAVQRRMTVQDLLAEALNDLFMKHGKPEIAPLERTGRGR
jgi:hypothetical protein